MTAFSNEDDLVGALIGPLGEAMDAAVRTVLGVDDLRDGEAFTAALEDMLRAVLPALPSVAALSISHAASVLAAPRTLAATSDDATALDRMQYRSGEGPCLDALGGEDVLTPSLADDARWPGLGQAVAGSGLPTRGVVSRPLWWESGGNASLNTYLDPAGNRPSSRVTALVDLAAGVVALSTGLLLHRRRAENLAVALETNRRIGAALGVVVTRHHMTYDAAFDRLRRISQLTHRKLRDVAEEVLLTGALPDVPR